MLAFIGDDSDSEKFGFDYWIASPIKDNKPGSTQKLKNLVQATCLRRTKAAFMMSLGLQEPVREVEYVTLYKDDQELYNFFKKKTADLAGGLTQGHKGSIKGRIPKEGNILVLMNSLRRICNHGKELLPSAILAAWKMPDKTLYDWQLMQASWETCNVCGKDFERTNLHSLDLNKPIASHHRSICADCTLAEDDTTGNQTLSQLQKLEESTTNKFRASSLEVDDIEPSAKVDCLLRNLYKDQQEEMGGSVAKR